MQHDRYIDSMYSISNAYMDWLRDEDKPWTWDAFYIREAIMASIFAHARRTPERYFQDPYA